MTQKNKESNEEKDMLAQKLVETQKVVQEMETELKKKEIESENVYAAKPKENQQ